MRHDGCTTDRFRSVRVDELHDGIFTSLRIIPLRGVETSEIAMRHLRPCQAGKRLTSFILAARASHLRH